MQGGVTISGMQRAFESLHLGFAPRDISQIVALADPTGSGVVRACIYIYVRMCVC